VWVSSRLQETMPSVLSVAVERRRAALAGVSIAVVLEKFFEYLGRVRMWLGSTSEQTASPGRSPTASSATYPPVYPRSARPGLGLTLPRMSAIVGREKVGEEMIFFTENDLSFSRNAFMCRFL
jgi:hypothetical protein